MTLVFVIIISLKKHTVLTKHVTNLVHFCFTKMIKLTSSSRSLCSREAASSSFFSNKACPSSAASIKSVSIPAPLSMLPAGDEDEGRAKDRETEEDEERGKNESSRLGEGRLVFLGVNIVVVVGLGV